MSIPVSFIQKLGRGDLEYVPREGWGGLDGQNYVKESIQLTPISNVRIVSTGEREDRCSNVSECAQVLRRIQKYHMKFCGLEDIAYNYMIGGDGRVYEGRTWNYLPYRSAEYCDHLRKSVVDIAYLGDFNKVSTPPDDYQATLKLFIKYSIVDKNIKPDYTEYQDFLEDSQE
ncbi:peptidoglycan-recognition protein LF-like [Macrosteles quadrilineatus]|uniref:peptidoglycan-recognition protein LF-like n=1 Tax=Macrosteles quadrilineatus TaxID=74068 RepID=UPI0023E24202|nr:peptidoglycan-recognition protein LF-like [Macrosteles quadrilineatus]